MDEYVLNSLKSIFSTDQLKHFTETKIYFSYEMKYCNGMEPIRFTDAYIQYTFPPSDAERRNTTAIKLHELVSDAFTVLSYDESEGIKVRKPANVTKGNKAFENQEKALKCLKEFMIQHKYHERCLSILKELPNLSETQICEVLTAHLFAPLVPEKDVIVSRGMMNNSKDDKCPCGCQFYIKHGHTGIGDRRVWHGYPDIMVNSSAVSIQLSTEPDMDDTDDGQQPDPSKTKRHKFEDFESSEEEIFYSADEKTNETSIYSNYFMTQLVSQSITNSFAQKAAKTLSNQMIPTIGCNLHDFHVFLYDPDSDILMRRMECLEIISKENPHRLILPSVVELWLILNLHTFGSSMSEINANRLNKSGFKQIMEREHVLRFYNESVIFADKDMFSKCPNTTNHSPSMMLRDLMLKVVYNQPDLM